MTCAASVVVKRFILANFYTVLNNILGIFFIIVTYLKNPFKCPWEVKRQLMPPPPLSDRQYGVHKYLKANVSYISFLFNKKTTTGFEPVTVLYLSQAMTLMLIFVLIRVV